METQDVTSPKGLSFTYNEALTVMVVSQDCNYIEGLIRYTLPMTKIQVKIEKGYILLSREHGRKMIQEIVSGNGHHGPQLHKALLSSNLKSEAKFQNLNYEKEGYSKKVCFDKYLHN